MTLPKFTEGQTVFFNPATITGVDYDGVHLTPAEYERLITAKTLTIEDIYTDSEHGRYKYPAYFVTSRPGHYTTVAECMLLESPANAWAQKGD